MADNVLVTAGSGTTIRTDDVGLGVQIQVVKVALGLDGAEDLLLDSGQQTMANSLPTTLASDQSALKVVGDAAHDSAVSGNPVLVAGEARTSDSTAVANGDVARMTMDTLGKSITVLGAVHDLKVRGTANYTTATASDLIAAAGVGIRIVVTSVLVTNAHATVATKVELRDGTTVKMIGYAAAAGGGFAINDPNGLFITTANTAATGRCVTTGADVDITISGYKIAN